MRRLDAEEDVARQTLVVKDAAEVTIRKQRVIVVSEHAMARAGMVHGLNAQPDLEVVGEFDSCKDAVAAVMKSPPDAIVFELTLGGGHTLDAIERCRKAAKTTALVVIAGTKDPVVAERAIRIGIRGYVFKGAGRECLATATRYAINKRLYVCSCVGSTWLTHAILENRARDGTGELSNREFQVHELVARGESKAQISHLLGISEKTLNCHVESIKTKFQVASVKELRLRVALWHQERLRKDHQPE